MKVYVFNVRADEMPYYEMLRKEKGAELELHPEDLSEEIIPTLERGSGISVLGMMSYGEKVMKLLQKQGIFYLSTRTVGYNHIDLNAAKACGIHVCHAAYAPNGVADYTIMMMLLCLRKYKQTLWRSQVNDFGLDDLMGREMKDLTVGVMGTGNIGGTVIRELSGFGCKILAYDKYENPAVKGLATYVPLEEIYRQCDIITLHMPLFPETKHIINNESIAKMKKGVILINCARGELMDIESLIDGIEKEHIGALGVDCLEREEDIVHKDRRDDIFSNREMAYLRQFKNVVHTQHMAFYTDAAVKSMVECGVLGVLQMANGEKCPTQLT
jgi:D-lactate dehydrogenase